ncbi:MAG: hypothetical protein K4304_08465 [Propionicimonas sp.]
MGTYYDKLTAVANLQYANDDEAAAYQKIMDLIESCRQASATYRKDPGFNGRTATAAMNWLDDFDTRLQAKADELATAVTRHDLARAAMETAKAKQDKLADTLITPYEDQYVRSHGPYVDAQGNEITADAYLAQLSADRDAKRDEIAKTTLSAMNTAVEEQAKLIAEPIRPETSSSADTSSASHPSTPAAPVRPPHVVKPPRADTPDTDTSYPPLVPSTPKGKPVAGYQPPSVADRDDPRWGDGYVHTPTSGSSSMFGGMIGVGATGLAARSLAQLRAAGSPLGVTGAGSASSLGMRGAVSASANTAPRGGILSNAANGSRGGAAGAGRGSTARAGAAAAHGQGKQDKKTKRDKIKLIGYRAEHLDQDGTAAVPPSGAAPGDSSQLTPLTTHEDEDRW